MIEDFYKFYFIIKLRIMLYIEIDMSPYDWDSSRSRAFAVLGFSDLGNLVIASGGNTAGGVRPEISLVYWKVHRRL